MFETEFDRDNQNQFTIFNGQKEHADEPLKKAQLFIESNFGEKISVEELAVKFAMSRRNFVRRFKKATENTPLEYIQRVKIEAAKKHLESSTNNVSETMSSVGYTDEIRPFEIFLSDIPVYLLPITEVSIIGKWQWHRPIYWSLGLEQDL